MAEREPKTIAGILSTKLAAAISGVTVVGALAGAWVVLQALDAKAQERVDAGIVIMNATVAPVKAQAEATQKQLERFQAEMSAEVVRHEAYEARQEVKMDKLFERWQIANPAPRPKDAGPE